MSRSIGDISASEPLSSADIAGMGDVTPTGAMLVDVENWPDGLSLVDPTLGNLARVKAATPLASDPGLVTRNIPSGNQDVTVVNFPATQPVSGSVAVSNLPATQPVSGTVAVSNLPSTQAVSGTVGVNNFPATQAVSGPLTDTQLRAAAVPVSGPVTDAQLRATPLPVSGPLTDAQLRAAALFVQEKSVTPITATAASGAAVTLTIPAVVGQFHYISFIEITKYAVAALTGVAAPIVVTTTNLNGLAFTFETAQAIGTAAVRDYESASPLKSQVVNTATTIVCPAVTNVIWRVSCWYYNGA